MTTRRRFLTISAAAALLPQAAQAATTWRGVAFGADVSITLRGDVRQAEATLAAARTAIAAIEQTFSLYDPTSALSRLNNASTLTTPPPAMVQLCAMSDDLHRLTGGRFDPTVQPLWRALATGGDIAGAKALIGWDKVKFSTDSIQIGAGQALTFNGIAQGFATDRIVELLTAAGFDNTLVNIGEYRGVGGPWRLDLADPDHGVLGQRTLANSAIATSSPGAMWLGGGQSHILDPLGQPPAWSTVSVEADTAALADGLSTALCLTPAADMARTVARFPTVKQVTLVDLQGNLRRL